MILSMEMKELPRGQLNPYILSTMKDGDKYGYEIIEEIKEKTGIEIKQPSLYSSLKRMEVQKLVSSYWKDSAIGGKRHYYCLTNEGRKFLEDNPIIPVKKEKEESVHDDGIFLEPSKPVYLDQKNNETILAEQENIFDLTKKKEDKKVETIQFNVQNSETEPLQFNLFKEVDLASDDGKFITETIDDYNFPKIEKYEPSTLNVEPKNVTYLNSKIKKFEKTHEEKVEKQVYQEKIADLYAKQAMLNPVFDIEKSMAKINSKIDQYAIEKKQKEISQQVKIEKSDSQEQKSDGNTQKSSRIYNSYKSLEAYYKTKGIGFHEYSPNKKSMTYVNMNFVRFIRSWILLLVSLALSFGFHFGLNVNNLCSIAYAIIPGLCFVMSFVYLGLYLKSKSKNIIKPKKELISPLILPLVTLVLILFTIGLNLIFGFRANKTMEYFAVLVYPIIISFHFALIPFLNKIIIKTIKKIKQPNHSA